MKRPLTVSGYGVALSLKRTDYIVIDDRTEDNDAAGKTAEQDNTKDGKKDLKPLSQRELASLGLKAASYVMNADDSFDTLIDVSQDFPKHSAHIAAIEVSEDVVTEVAKNAQTGRMKGLFSAHAQNLVWINGQAVSMRDFDAHNLLEHIRRERKLISSAQKLGLSGADAISLLSSPQLAQAQENADGPPRYDWRDTPEGGHVIIWLNNLEKDKRYEDMPRALRALLQMGYPGQLPAVRRDIHNVIVPIDFSNYDHCLMLIENIQVVIKRGTPVRFGLAPLTTTPAAISQAEVFYHLYDTYGLSAALDYIQRVCHLIPPSECADCPLVHCKPEAKARTSCAVGL